MDPNSDTCFLLRKAATQSIISRDWDFTKLGIGGLDKVCFATLKSVANILFLFIIYNTLTNINIKVPFL